MSLARDEEKRTNGSRLLSQRISPFRAKVLTHISPRQQENREKRVTVFFNKRRTSRREREQQRKCRREEKDDHQNR